MEEQNTHAEGPPAVGPMTTGSTLPELSGLTEMVRTMMEDRERREREIALERDRRDREIAEERERRDRERDEERERMERQREDERRRYAEESERRIQDMHRQMERLQQLVTEQSVAAAARPRHDPEPAKLTRLTDHDDIEAYLTTFERIMEAHEVERERWSFKLAPQLTGRAQQAYAALPPDDAKSYEAVKTAILRRYNINEETYRKRFRKLRPKEGESPQELVTKLQDLATRWTKDSVTRDELLDLMVREQFLSILPEDVRISVIERQPKNSEEASKFAENYLQARSTSITPKEGKAPSTKCPRCGRHGHWARECPNPRNSGPRNTEGQDTSAKTNDTNQHRNTNRVGWRGPRPYNTDVVKCYNCNEKGHISSNCPQRSLYCGQLGTRAPEQDKAHRHGTVNGIYCRDIVVDTGATQTLVHKALVTDDDILEGEVTIRCAHGDTTSYPLAVVKITIGGKDIITTAAVSGTLPASVLLGWDVPELMNFVADSPECSKKDVLAVTRSCSQRPRAAEEQSETDVQAASSPMEMSTDTMPEAEELAFNFDDSLFSPSDMTPRPSLTRAQKRENRRRFRWDHELNISATELRILQDKDTSLQRIREIADGVPSAAAGEEYFRREGLVYRLYRPPGADDDDARTFEQLVLPTVCRKAVLQLAHDIPMAGHLGKKKTGDRVLQRFYWPGVFRDVEDHCRTCEQCQKTSSKNVKKAPLLPLPIMDEPFKRIAMDIVGPLPRSSTGKRFILVICDYATRYPEAIALRNIDANTVAEGLLQFFARVGVPEEILTDQGTNFTSQLLAEVYRFLHIRPIKTTPYHPQTDGLVERFNRTLKSMLKKAASKDGKDWDRILPYLLFAYREVPQASTGFSPFELLYGHHVRGPLDILKESWEASTKSPESVVSYVLTMQERLAAIRDVVHENLQNAQTTQKEWYDRNARNREFQPGDQVLVLLPTSTNKLLAEWCGPYPVIRQLGPVNYEVKMTDRRKQRRIFHINMLRQWHSPSAVSLYAEEVSKASPSSDLHDDADDVVTWNDRVDGEAQIGHSLDQAQREGLDMVFSKVPGVLNNQPGRTQLIEHRIVMTDVKPVRLPPYRLPQAYRETVREELQQMEEAGIIERSSSEWSAPIVLVKKKDGALRMCVDYRRLNAQSRADAYPMPRIDDLLDRLGSAKFLSTLDLSRGYWQVPMSEDSQAKTAFTTPFGLFQFKVMPFGLQGAPATFQRMMDILLNDVGEYASAYLDDVVIFSRTWEEHLLHLEEILRRLGRAGLTVKTKKCQFGMQQCTYLGHIVGNGEVRPECSKQQAVYDFQTPKTKKQVRTFLGLTGYYRKFIPGYSDTAAVLTDLTRKAGPNRVDWTAQCEQAFRALKNVLCSDAVLKSPDFDQPFVLQTDASDRGIGAVLSQYDDKGQERPIAFYSRKLLPREERYSVVEKECLAIKLATHAFRVYLLGRPFTIQTDHRALEWLNRLKDNNPRLTRWSLALQPYAYTVQYRAGIVNGNADALSRAYSNPESATSSQEKGGGM